MPLAIVAALAQNDVIGKDGGLPWHLAADLRRFKALTMGHHLLVGRRTWESIGRPLPGRTIVVLTRSRDFTPPPGVLVAHDLDRALALAAGDPEPFVAGGAEIYRAALPRAERLYLTRVEAEVEGDTRFPTWNQDEWVVTARESHPADDRNDHPTTFLTYARRQPSGEVARLREDESLS